MSCRDATCYKQQSWAVLLCVGPPAHPAACEGAAADGGEAAKDWQDGHSKLPGKVNQVNRRVPVEVRVGMS